MSTLPRQPLSTKWKERLDLSRRAPPELYEKAEDVRNTPHAGAIRAALEDMGASAVFCVQGVPTITFVTVDNYDRDAVTALHAELWNQGLSNLLLVITNDTVRAFSLSRIPYAGIGEKFDSRCLVETLNATADALALRNLIYGAESGRLWDQYDHYFDPKERVDQVLLENLTRSHELLCEDALSPNAAQALLIQAMFIAYLEDREITNSDYFLGATGRAARDFSSLLDSGDSNLLNRLFDSLRNDFNGDLFVAPCSFEASGRRPRVTKSHLKILARFRSGREEMAKGHEQLRFWGYNFKYIPIELISAVYDRFLGEREAERREQGAYYTPMFLADTVISQVWNTLPAATKEKGEILDPACGSGVFLVRSFQRMCEYWRETRKSQTIRWDSLCTILSRLHGWDINEGAVRVAVFSLYVALLEEVSPPDIRQLIKRGKILPELWGRNLCAQDFFSVEPEKSKADLVIGNPPWTSRRGSERPSVRWSAKAHLPMPGQEDAWAFTWKSLLHLRNGGIVAFLLPAMGFLHNHADKTVEARNRLIREAHIRLIINFADLRFQLFDGAIRPAALLVFGKAATSTQHYRFEYWTPKADFNLQTKRLITLTSADKSLITSKEAIADSLVFKHHLWMSEPDAKLFNYLSSFSRLGSFINDYGSQHRRKENLSNQWLVGQGFQPFNARPGSQSEGYKKSNYVGKLPYLAVGQLQPLVQQVHDLPPWESSRVRRKGFELGFQGPRILIPRGVSVTHTRLKASYVEAPLTFQDILQAIVVPSGQESTAKLLTALLNSRVAFWYAFHGTASFGSDRPEVKQAELLRLPFPLPNETPEPARSQNAKRGLIAIVDAALNRAKQRFTLQPDQSGTYNELDRLAYEYFCLSEDEIILIEDAVERIIPAAQPNQGTIPEIWKLATAADRKAYANTLIQSLAEWFDEKSGVHVNLEAQNPDLAILRLALEDQNTPGEYVERHDLAVRDALARLTEHIHQPLTGNFQLIPDFRLFVGKNLYLVKPAQKRYWLRSSALADANAIALDLQDAERLHQRAGEA